MGFPLLVTWQHYIESVPYLTDHFKLYQLANQKVIRNHDKKRLGLKEEIVLFSILSTN